MTEFPLEEATIVDVQRGYESGIITCAELTGRYLERIARLQASSSRLNAITSVNPDAMEQARERDRQRASGKGKGIFHGIPVLLKDNINTRTIATTNGSAAMRSFMPPDNAFITDRLLEAGAVILGKAAMGEFAGDNYNTIDGAIRNPYHPKRSPSGSSGGSAVAVSCNLAMVSVGTDASTSVRLPAAMAGIVGLRPTTGLISRYGIAPKNLLFDTAGPMARTVEDAVILLEAMSGRDERDDKNVEAFEAARQAGALLDNRGGFNYRAFLRRGSLKGTRLGIPESFIDGVHPEIRALTEQTLQVMRDLGAEIVAVEIDADLLEEHAGRGGLSIRKFANYCFREDFEAYLSSVGSSLPSVQDFLDFYEGHDRKSHLPVEESVRTLLERSLNHSKEEDDYRRIVEDVLPDATRRKQQIFDRFQIDALVFPTSAEFASVISTPALKEQDPSYAPLGHPRRSLLTLAGYSSVGNPEIVVPMGFGKQGMPMTISIMGRPYEEGRIIGFAYDFEQETKARRAPILPV